MKAPHTPAQALVDTYHGTPVADPYRFLEDQTHPDVRAWIAAQNAYTDAHLADLPQRAPLREAFRTLTDIDAYGMPLPAGDGFVFQRRLAHEDLSCICLRTTLLGDEDVLIDPHPMSDDNSLSVSLMDVSPDGNLLLYGIRKGGEDEVVLRVFDIAARRDTADAFERATYLSAGFHPGDGGVVYTRRLEAGPRIYHHVLGRPQTEDTLIFGADLGPEMLAYAVHSDDGAATAYLVPMGSSGNRDIYLAGPTDTVPRLLVSSADGWFSPVFAGDHLVLVSKRQAPFGKLLAAPLSDIPTQIDAWPVLVPECAGATITAVSAVGGRLFVNYMENVCTHLEIFDIQGAGVGRIALPTLGGVSQMYGRWDRGDGFFSFSSIHVPDTVYHYQVADGTQTLWHAPDLPDYTADLALSQAWCTSADGTRIPMFLLHRKDLVRDGARPTHLYGYGGFRASLGPTFSGRAVLWAQHGGVYATVNLRGGAEFGEAWHRAGMLESKQNTFDDFYAAIEYLHEAGYSNPARTCISGGSNGGLLVGAAVTQRPELFRAAACLYPLLDMVRFHRFLMGPYWVSEYGSADVAEQFPFIYAYSPYHQVRPHTTYPAVIIVTGDADTRVAPLHARKMTAALQAAQAGEAPILLLYDTVAGHVAGGSKDHAVENACAWMAFLMDQVGMT